MSKVTDELLEHDYDGIQEYDNPLPGWWKILLYGAIAYAVIYVPYYHFGPGPLMMEEYAAEMAAAPKQKVASVEDMAAAVNDETKLAAGKVTFTKLCVACHRADLGGLVGPNLTDDFWKNGGSLADIGKTITSGIPNTAMVAWNTQLSGDQIVEVAAYVKSMRGTKPENPKAPEGEPYKE